MKNELTNIIDNAYGNVFSVGIVDMDLIKKIQTSKKITGYLMINFNQKVEYYNTTDSKKVKNVRIKKIKKRNKKINIDITICEISDIKSHFYTFIDDSIYFSKKTIYYYGKKEEYELDSLIKKYRRYNVTVSVYDFDDEFILEIDTSKAKTNKFKRFIYKIIDGIELILNGISDFLVS